MEAERPKQRWNGVDDPISHCLAGNSLLLTGLPAPESTWPGPLCTLSKTHCSAQNWPGAQTADHWGAGTAREWRRSPAGHGALGGPVDSWTGRFSAPLEHSQLIRDLAGGHRHELTENMRHLQLRGCGSARRRAPRWSRQAEEAPLQARWPDTTLSSATASAWPSTQRRTGPGAGGLKALRVGDQVPHRFGRDPKWV